MRKKLVKQGHNTLTVTIPAKWVKENTLKAGDELELTVSKNSLILSTTKFLKEEKISLDLTSLDKTTTNWLLAAAYKKGYDEIFVTYKNNSQLREISKRLKECLKDYEIVEQNNFTITIKTISNLDDEKFDSLLRRIFMVNEGFFESIIETLENKKYHQLMDLIYLEETNDSLVNACQRMIVKNRKIENREASFLYVIIWQLEKIADTLKHFCQENCSKKQISNSLVERFKEILEVYKNYYRLYYKFDQQEIDKVIKKKKILLSSLKKEEDKYLNLLAEQILDLSGPYMALKI